MSERFVIALIKHETNTFSPIAAESWPSNVADRATFEALLQPLDAI